MTPDLYPNDFSLQFQQNSFVYFDEVISFLLNTLPFSIYTLFFVVMFLVRFLTIYAITGIVNYLTQNRSFSFFAPLLFFFPQPAFGAAMRMFEAALYPRSVSLMFSLLFLLFFLYGRTFLSTLFLSFGILMHPLTAIPFFAFFVLASLVEIQKRTLSLSSFLMSFFVPLAVGFFSLFSGPATDSSLFTRIDPVWKNILVDRVPYLYIAEWHYSIFLTLAATLIVALTLRVFIRNLLKTSLQRVSVWLLLVLPLVLTFISFVMVDLLNFHFFAQLQLTRGLLLLRFVVILFLGYFTYQRLTSKKSSQLYIFSLLGLLLSLAIEDFFVLLYLPLYLILWWKEERIQRLPVTNNFLGSLFAFYTLCFVGLLYITESFTLLTYFVPLFIVPLALSWLLSSSTSLPSRLPTFLMILLPVVSLLFVPFFSVYPPYFQNQELVDTCTWIEEHLPLEALFLTEPFSTVTGPTRMTCLRSVFAGRKEGAQSAFQREYALEWDTRMRVLDELNKHPETLEDVAETYHIDYVLSEKELNLSLVYSNSKYYVYEL
jgi:hypothetical protein